MYRYSISIFFLVSTVLLISLIPRPGNNNKREKSFTTHFQSPALNHYNLLNETKMGHFRAVSGSSKSIQVKSGSATKWTFMNYSLPKVLNKIHHTVLNFKVGTVPTIILPCLIQGNYFPFHFKSHCFSVVDCTVYSPTNCMYIVQYLHMYCCVF